MLEALQSRRFSLSSEHAVPTTQPPGSKAPAKARRSKAVTTEQSSSHSESEKLPKSLEAADANPHTIPSIKKYPNHHSDNTETSTYITLTEIRELVMRSAMFVVRDAKSGDDLTRSILLQIILEEESGGEPMFTEAVLANIIRFYGNAMQSFMGSYLEQNVQTFMDLQTKMAEQSKGLSPEKWTQIMGAQSPMMKGMLGTYVEQSKTVFAQMQEQMQQQSEKMLSAFGLKR
jgi:polyhydroxyalkanoate synthesis repressor PhaR